MPEEQIREFAIYGTPEDLLREIELLEQVGIQYLIVDLDPTRELEALDVFANKIIKKYWIKWQVRIWKGQKNKLCKEKTILPDYSLLTEQENR